MKLFSFYWEGDDAVHSEWQCAAKDLRMACGKFCGMHPEIQEFRVSCRGDVELVLAE